jgi:hypothetical protein
VLFIASNRTSLAFDGLDLLSEFGDGFEEVSLQAVVSYLEDGFIRLCMSWKVLVLMATMTLESFMPARC